MDGKDLNFTSSTDQQELMEKLGIRHILVDVFYYRDYRYGKFDDAIAQAMRDLQPGKNNAGALP